MPPHPPEPMDGILDTAGGGGVFAGVSFSARHRLYRAIWNATWLLLAAWTPPPLHGWRAMLLRMFGARIGPGARIYGSARIWYPPNLEMGANAVLGWRVNCYNQGRIVLEDHAVVSQFAHLVSGTHDIDDPGFQLRTHPIRIGRNAWVAANAFVGPGVTIGEGAVLGAAGVAFNDLEPWTVYGGNPARVIRPRAKVHQPPEHG